MFLGKLSQLAAPLRMSLLRLRGPARYGGGQLSAIYAGNGANLEFLQGLFLAGGEIEPLASGLHPLSFHPAIGFHREGADLVLCELPALWAPLLPRSASLRVRAWIRQEILLPEAPGKEGWLLPRAVEREAARRVRRHGYVIDFTSETEAMRLFFRGFYRPYVQSRFGAGSHIDDEGTFMDRCRGQTLARLHTDGQWVAGLLVRRQGRKLRFGRFGAASSPPSPGASEVLDHLVIHHMHGLGVRHIVMGDTRPCLADGVFRYKARFGAHVRPTLFPQPTLSIEVRRWTESVTACLTEQPLVAMAGGAPQVWRIREPGRIELEPLATSRPANP